MFFRLNILLSFLLVWSFQLHAQFVYNGIAENVGGDCHLLTPALDGQAGAIWSEELISLDESFNIIANVFLGCTNKWGADGIAFGFQPISSSLGTGGQGLGFLGVQPSLAVEIDTHANEGFADPSEDHLAIFKNGDNDHTTTNTWSDSGFKG